MKRTTEERMREFVREALAADIAIEKGAAVYRAEDVHLWLERLCRRFHIRKLALFGSAARGDMKPDSDVDLMIEFEPDRAPSLWDSAGLNEEFSALFGNRAVDIVPPEILRNPYRRKTIQRDLKVLYEAR